MVSIEIFTKTSKKIDADKLIDTRALICANSGGGKSYAARRIMEETADKVMSIIFDVDGEFKTLREKYDFLLIGDPEEGADVEINMSAADLLPKKIMELEVSTIIDISDFSLKDRIKYVKKFLRALLELPREFWKACLVFLDEAHKFCGQQEKQESTFEVVDLMSQGRKRGYSGILMTQRISKLHKDAAAEANNVLIGRTTLDIDQKRAGEIIGFSSKNEIRELRNLKDGEFWAFGPAIDNEVEKVQVNKAKTTHPKRGQTVFSLSKPTDKIKSILEKISGLPEQAKKELKEIADFKAEIVSLKRQIKILETSQPKPQADEKALERARQQGFNEASKEYTKQFHEIERDYKALHKKFSDIGKIVGAYVPELKFNNSPQKTNRSFQNNEGIQSQHPSTGDEVDRGRQGRPRSEVDEKSPVLNLDEDIKLGLAERKIYSLLYQYPDKVFSKPQIGVFTGYSWKGGGFNNALGKLNSLGLISRNGDSVQISEIRPELSEGFDFSKEAIVSKLGKCEREIYNVLLENPYEEFTKESIAEQTPSNYEPRGGGFNNAIGRLNTLGVIEKGNGTIKLNPELLEIC